MTAAGAFLIQDAIKTESMLPMGWSEAEVVLSSYCHPYSSFVSSHCSSYQSRAKNKRNNDKKHYVEKSLLSLNYRKSYKGHAYFVLIISEIFL